MMIRGVGQRFEPLVTGTRAATQAELLERGWLHQGGIVYRQCELFREQAASKGYRFDIDARVLCRVGRFDWIPGTIVRLMYREYEREEGRFAPYQIILELDRAPLVFLTLFSFSWGMKEMRA